MTVLAPSNCGWLVRLLLIALPSHGYVSLVYFHFFFVFVPLYSLFFALQWFVWDVSVFHYFSTHFTHLGSRVSAGKWHSLVCFRDHVSANVIGVICNWVDMHAHVWTHVCLCVYITVWVSVMALWFIYQVRMKVWLQCLNVYSYGLHALSLSYRSPSPFNIGYTFHFFLRVFVCLLVVQIKKEGGGRHCFTFTFCFICVFVGAKETVALCRQCYVFLCVPPFRHSSVCMWCITPIVQFSSVFVCTCVYTVRLAWDILLCGLKSIRMMCLVWILSELYSV